MDFRIAAGFLTSNLSDQFAGFFPILKRRGHNTTNSFQGPHMAFDEAYSTGIPSPSVKLLGDNTGEIRSKDQGQTVTLKEARPILRLQRKQIDVCVKENRQRSYL